MDTQTLPLVPFGKKYKGQPITALLNDTEYLEWCKKQEWFKNYPIIYNICVNQTITTNQNSPTPEHNKLQNMFLNKLIQIKLLNNLYGIPGVKFTQNFELLMEDEEFIKNFDSSTITLNDNNSKLNVDGIVLHLPELTRSLENTKIVFEAKFNWDFMLYYDDYQSIHFETKHGVDENLTKECLYNLLKNYNFAYNQSDYTRECEVWISKSNNDVKIYDVNISTICKNVIVCCELKPVLGDEYPCVLRKMKTQIELTKNDKRDFGCEITRCYILIIGSFTSVHVTKDELITIFKLSLIHI